MCWYEVPLTNWTEIVYSSHFRMGGTRLVLVHSVQSVSSPRAFISTVHEGINWKAFISTVHEGINWKTDDGIVGMSTRIQMLYSIRSLNKEIIEINEKKKSKKSVYLHSAMHEYLQKIGCTGCIYTDWKCAIEMNNALLEQGECGTQSCM